MTKPDPTDPLARWLDQPAGSPAPADLDRRVVEGVYALRPDLAPPARVTVQDILLRVGEGPLRAERPPGVDALADWLDGPDDDLPAELEAEVGEALLALRPDLAPAPRVSLDDILAGVRTGPFAQAASDADAPAAAPLQPPPAAMAAAPEVVPLPPPAVPAAPAARPAAPRGANNNRWWAAGGMGALLAAAAALLVIVPMANRAPTGPLFMDEPAPDATAAAAPSGDDLAAQRQGAAGGEAAADSAFNEGAATAPDPSAGAPLEAPQEKLSAERSQDDAAENKRDRNETDAVDEDDGLADAAPAKSVAAKAPAAEPAPAPARPAAAAPVQAELAKKAESAATSTGATAGALGASTATTSTTAAGRGAASVAPTGASRADAGGGDVSAAGASRTMDTVAAEQEEAAPSPALARDPERREKSKNNLSDGVFQPRSAAPKASSAPAAAGPRDDSEGSANLDDLRAQAWPLSPPADLTSERADYSAAAAAGTIEALTPFMGDADWRVAMDAAWRVGRKQLDLGFSDRALATVASGLGADGSASLYRARLLALQGEALERRGDLQGAERSYRQAAEAAFGR